MNFTWRFYKQKMTNMPLINSDIDTKPKTNDLFISKLSNIPANLSVNKHTNRQTVTYITTALR